MLKGFRWVLRGFREFVDGGFKGFSRVSGVDKFLRGFSSFHGVFKGSMEVSGV